MKSTGVLYLFKTFLYETIKYYNQNAITKSTLITTAN